MNYWQFNEQGAGFITILQDGMSQGIPHLRGDYMAENTQISWTGKTWNPIDEKALMIPLKARKPSTYFVGDLFHENIKDEWIDKVFAVMALCPQHTFQILTKRADRMLDYFQQDTSTPQEFRSYKIWLESILIGDPFEASPVHNRLRTNNCNLFPLPNVWLGVSVENQKQADERIPLLLETPAKIRFLSCEPLLEEVDLTKYLGVKNETKEQRRNSLQSSSQWRINDRQSGQNLEEEQTSGTQHGRVFSDSEDVQLEKDLCSGASLGLSTFFREDSRRVDNQSHQRQQKGQPSRELGTSNLLGTDSARIECVKEKSKSAKSVRREQSQYETNTNRCGNNSETSSNGGEIEGHCKGFQHSISVGVTDSQRTALDKIDWTIVGGESGGNARDCRVSWIRSIVKQCKASEVPVFVKQLGSRVYINDLICSGYLQLENKKGADISEFPKDLQIQEFPK